MKLVGICGEAGSGKDTVAGILKRAVPDAAAISLGDLVRQQLSSMGIKPDRELQRAVADYRRMTIGGSYWIELALSHAPSGVQIALLIGIYSPDEARHLQGLGGVLAWVETPKKLRVQRIAARADGPRDELLAQDADEFMNQLEAEQGDAASTEGSATSLTKIKALAQHVIRNDGGLADLERAVAEFVIYLDQEFSRPSGNLGLIVTSDQVGYDAATPWTEEVESLAKLEKTHFFEMFLGGADAVAPGERVEVIADMPLREAVQILYKPNLRSITGNQTAKRIAAIFEEKDARLAIDRLRALKPSNQEEEYFVSLSDTEFYDVHLKAHLLWIKSLDSILAALKNRLQEIRKTDRMQFDGKRDRSLERMRKDGVVFRVSSQYVGQITKLTQNPMLTVRPLLEVVKNDRIFEVSGFIGSKASLVVHDVVDHLWAFDLLDKIGLFAKYEEMLSAIGNPERVDIYRREGEAIASIAYGVRAFQGVAPGFRPLVGSKDIVRMVREMRGSLNETHTDALRIVNNLESDGTEWRSLGYTYSNYLTELDEQRRTHGRIKFRDPNSRRIIGELDPTSADYLCFFIEAHHALLESKNKHRNALFYTHFILEEYLRSIGPEGTQAKLVAITPGLLDGTRLKHSSVVPKDVSEWMFRNYGFTASRNQV
jgi:predicted kinase